ncbi:hypothetical protein KPH14_008474 [Odynerus spinipes]|uniref:RNA helicase n=1 Tax=Odynerus spinipes TaxID=1348599 RepID=A0AAD9VKQ3_9HYME|nr:hypothetical protein KPH14_008474 [Odynerus spinipes]
MFGYRIVLCINERIHYRSIQPLHMTQSYELFIKQFHSNKKKQYCTSIKDEGAQRESEMNNIHMKKPIQPDFESMSNHRKFFNTDLSKEHRHRELNSKTNTTNNTFERKNAISLKDLHALYSNPVHTVHSIYNIVNKELDDNSVLNVHYKKCKTNPLLWTCTYSICWPHKEEIIAHGVSKVAASKQAALKCLNLLHTQQRIKDGKPIIYSDKEIQNKLHKPIPINFNFEIMEEVKTLLNTYEMHIKDKIEHLQLQNNITSFASPEKDFIYRRSNSFLYSFTRNKELQDRYFLNNLDVKNNLPIFEYRDEILKKLENNQIIVIKGDTGCGKTTQVPQFIMNSFISKGNATDCNILISQPRKISAISLAERIAFERKETVGDVVGYHVRLERNLPKLPGGMVFCTTGILRQLMQVNPNLIGYSHVILDEAHERSLDIDVLLVLLKRAMQNNSSLKLIIMSATINTDLFQNYYNCTSVDIPGKTYPVKVHFIEDFQNVLPTLGRKEDIDDNNNKPTVNCQDIANLIRWIIKTKPPGTILCFLPGWMEIMKVNELLIKQTSIANKVLILPLHSKLSNISQRKIFDPAPPSIIKVILATDIAETGITVPDVVYVVDSAIKNNFLWDEKKCTFSMNYEKLSQANIQQRKGRAGRTQPGESYHFIRKEEYNHLDLYAIPDILRSSLEKTVVEIKTYTNEMVEEFCESMLQPPNRIALHKAVDVLRELNILDKYENLTPLGRLVAQIPVHPTLGKALVLSTVFQCFQPMLHITTIYSMDKDLFANSLGTSSLKKEIKQRFHKTSDHLAMAMLYGEWKNRSNESVYENDLFCNEMNISPFKIKLASKTCNAFFRYLKECDLLEQTCHLNDKEMLPNKHACSEEIIHGIILSSTNKLLQYSAYSYHKGVFRKKSQHITENNRRAEISSESVNCARKIWPSPFLIYLNGVHLHSRPTIKINDVSIISPLTTLLFNQGHIYYEREDSNDYGNIVINIGNRRKLRFSCSLEEAHVLISFHNVIWSVADYFIRIKYSDINRRDELYHMNEYWAEVLNVLSKMLSTNVEDNE